MYLLLLYLLRPKTGKKSNVRRTAQRGAWPLQSLLHSTRQMGGRVNYTCFTGRLMRTVPLNPRRGPSLISDSRPDEVAILSKM